MSTFSLDAPECPYCGRVDRDMWDYEPKEGVIVEAECDCGMNYNFVMGITYHFAAYKKDERVYKPVC